MFKTPIKVLAILLALFVVLVASVGCGKDADQPPDVSTPGGAAKPAEPTPKPAESVSFVTVTEQNISIKLPSSMTQQEGPYGGFAYADTNTGDTASFRVDRADESFPVVSMTKQEFADFFLGDLDDLVIISYENNKTLNGNKAVVCKFSFTTHAGNEVTAVFINVLYKNGDYLISLSYSSDNEDGALAKNIQTCIESIRVSY